MTPASRHTAVCAACGRGPSARAGGRLSAAPDLIARTRASGARALVAPHSGWLHYRCAAALRHDANLPTEAR